MLSANDSLHNALCLAQTMFVLVVVLFVMSKSLFAGICLAFFQMTDGFAPKYNFIHYI